MRLVIQRVSEASVTVDGEVASSIGAGLLVLCGIHNDDDGEELGDKRLAEKVTKETIDWAARKVCNTRLWEDKSGKMWTQSAAQGGHEILLVSNFTLWAKLKGNKPDLHDAMGPDRARAFWERFVKVVQGMHKGKVQQGQFGADMKVRLCNDGPLTVTLDSPEVALPAAKAKPAAAEPAAAEPAAAEPAAAKPVAAKPAPKAEAMPDYAIAAPYLAEVSRRRAAAAAQAAAAASADGAWAVRAAATAAPFTLDVRDADSLSAAEVRSSYLARFRPLVVTGATERITEPEWTLEWLVQHVGSKQVAVNVGGSQTTSCTFGVDVMPFRELAARLGAGEELYLYDMSIPLKLPTLTEHVGFPAYYAHDWLQRTRELHAFSRSWPSLFVGAPGTRSSLHIDQWKGHFWMAQLQGRCGEPHPLNPKSHPEPLLPVPRRSNALPTRGSKRWTIFHPDDAWCLAPVWPEGSPRLEPSFPDLDAMQADPARYPLLGLARRVDVTLRPGMLLLVPGGAPHRVVNGAGAVSIAIAGNFVDASNAAAAVADLELMANRRADGPPERGAAAAAAALAELDITDADDAPSATPHAPSRRVIPWAEYARGAGAEWARDAASPEEPAGREADDAAVGIVALAAGDGGDSSEDDTSFWRSDGEYSSASDGEAAAA